MALAPASADPSARSLDQLLQELHALSDHAKGAAFERLVAWLLRHAPEFREVASAEPFARWEGRWSQTDIGTDLIATTHDGAVWAVQAKCYGAEHAITKTDVHSFLSDTNR